MYIKIQFYVMDSWECGRIRGKKQGILGQKHRKKNWKKVKDRQAGRERKKGREIN